MYPILYGQFQCLTVCIVADPDEDYADLHVQIVNRTREPNLYLKEPFRRSESAYL